MWKNRNNLLYRGKEQGPLELVNRSIEDFDEWVKRKEDTRIQGTMTGATQRNIPWSKPPPSWIKCNIDGAWSQDNSRSGLGWVLRDQEGKTIWMGARAVYKMRNAFEVEAEALRWALITMIQFGYKKIIFETDAANLKSLIEESGMENSPLPIIQDISNLLTLVGEVKLLWTPRNTNGVAHRLAKESMTFVHYDPMLYSIPPSWIKAQVMKDSCVTNVG